MKKLLQFLSRTPILVISGIAIAGIFFYFSAAGNPAPAGTENIISLQLAFNTEKFASILNNWGVDGRGVFLNTMWLDFIFPLVYAFFLSGLAVAVFRERFERKASLWFLLPFAAAVLDYVENILHIILVSSGNYQGSLILLASVFAACKWFILSGVSVVLIVGLGMRIFRHEN